MPVIIVGLLYGMVVSFIGLGYYECKNNECKNNELENLHKS